MTRITALEICTNGDNIKCSGAGPSTENGKYVGWIEMWRDGDLHKTMLSSDAVYNSENEAEKAMQEIVDKIQKMDPDEIFNPAEMFKS